MVLSAPGFTLALIALLLGLVVDNGCHGLSMMAPEEYNHAHHASSDKEEWRDLLNVSERELKSYLEELRDLLRWEENGADGKDETAKLLYLRNVMDEKDLKGQNQIDWTNDDGMYWK